MLPKRGSGRSHENYGGMYMLYCSVASAYASAWSWSLFSFDPASDSMERAKGLLYTMFL
jgi:hypothetical protein